MKIRAFTLAEVLITMGVIGVVAAVLIPSVVNWYEKKVTVEKLKVAYSMFSQAVQRSVEDNGDVSDWEYFYSNMAPKYIFPYVETIGEVKKYTLYTYANKTACIHWGAWGATGKIYALKNGMTYSLIYDHGGLYLMVDLNGKRKPNYVGRDGFAFLISPEKNKLEMVWEEQTREKLLSTDYPWYGCAVFDNYYARLSCGALIMHDGWKIKPDYPW